MWEIIVQFRGITTKDKNSLTVSLLRSPYCHSGILLFLCLSMYLEMTFNRWTALPMYLDMICILSTQNQEPNIRSCPETVLVVRVCELNCVFFTPKLLKLYNKAILHYCHRRALLSYSELMWSTKLLFNYLFHNV